jgi:hypothetical protein
LRFFADKCRKRRFHVLSSLLGNLMLLFSLAV